MVVLQCILVCVVFFLNFQCFLKGGKLGNKGVSMIELQIIIDLIVVYGLKFDEYQCILDIIGCELIFIELGIFLVMWNEYCFYKFLKKWLCILLISGLQVICGLGENVGVVDIGDGQVVVFKMESYNYFSYIELYQGVVIGVGGILCDVFIMGVCLIVVMDVLFFGLFSYLKIVYLVKGVVEGIGVYGNVFGVLNVGGEVWFYVSYNGNCFVNVFVVGLVDIDKIFYLVVLGVGMFVVYFGVKIGCDGVGGVIMVLVEFDDMIEEKCFFVQVGDFFIEKCLLEVCFELMKIDSVILIQDMGVVGLICFVVEMGDKGGLGIKLVLDNVLQCEIVMIVYEMMLLELQECMLMVLKFEKEVEVCVIFEKWDLDFVIVGEIIVEDCFLIVYGNEVKVDLLLLKLFFSVLEYDCLWVEMFVVVVMFVLFEISLIVVLKVLIGKLSYVYKVWVWQ